MSRSAKVSGTDMVDQSEESVCCWVRDVNVPAQIGPGDDGGARPCCIASHAWPIAFEAIQSTHRSPTRSPIQTHLDHQNQVTHAPPSDSIDARCPSCRRPPICVCGCVCMCVGIESSQLLHCFGRCDAAASLALSLSSSACVHGQHTTSAPPCVCGCVCAPCPCLMPHKQAPTHSAAPIACMRPPSAVCCCFLCPSFAPAAASAWLRVVVVPERSSSPPTHATHTTAAPPARDRLEEGWTTSHSLCTHTHTLSLQTTHPDRQRQGQQQQPPALFDWKERKKASSHRYSIVRIAAGVHTTTTRGTRPPAATKRAALLAD